MADLTPANENPWYVLMTLYGEQKGDEVDEALHAENRKVWNTLIQQGGGAGEGAREVVAGMPSRDAWRDQHSEVRTKWKQVYEERNGIPFPEGFDLRARPCDLSRYKFESVVMLDGYFMPNVVIFDGSTFTHGLKSRSGYWGGRLSLVGCPINGHVDLQDSVFADGFSCREAKIRGDLQLTDARMLGELIFDGVEIDGSLVATRIGSERSLESSGVKISKKADFSDANFESSANFDDTTF
jgi:hypothetical protein